MENEYNPTCLRPEIDVYPMEKSSYVMYKNAYYVENDSFEELAVMENPYFNRSVEHFCSHQHTPSSRQKAGSGVLYKENVAYIAWDIFDDYGTSGSYILKKIVCCVLDRLLTDNKSVETNLPAQGVVTLAKQKNRYISHLLYVSPVKRGDGIEVVEDIVPIYNVEVSVKTDANIKSVKKVPEMEALEFIQKNGRVSFVVDKLENHQMIEIETE